MKMILLVTLLFTGCASFAAPEKMISQSKVLECIESQVDLYGDLCGEADIDGSDPHFNGVECAVQSIKWCLDL